MSAKTFVLSVLVPLLTLIVLLAIAGCSMPTKQDRHHSCPCQRVKVSAFTASWCGPCQRAKPTLVQIQAAGVDVEVIDIDDHPDLAKKYAITSVPTFIVNVCGNAPVRTNDILVVVSLIRRGCK